MAILTFEKPKKVRKTEEHNIKFMSDSGVNGTYVPNMSEDDMKRWKAKHIEGDNERIELKKTLHGVQLVIVVRKNKPKKYPSGAWNSPAHKQWYEQRDNIKISMNGSLWMSFDEQIEMQQAIEEAKTILGI